MTEPTATDATTPAPTLTATTTPAPTVTPVTFTPEQEAEKNRQIAAARRKAEEDARKTLADAAADAAAKAEADAKVKAQEARGEYDAAKAAIEQERDTAKADAKAHEDRLATALETIRPGVETRWADLPDEVKALYDGADDDVLAKAAHLDKTAPLVARLTAATTARVGLTPRPTGATVPDTVTSPVTQRQITG